MPFAYPFIFIFYLPPYPYMYARNDICVSHIKKKTKISLKTYQNEVIIRYVTSVYNLNTFKPDGNIFIKRTKFRASTLSYNWLQIFSFQIHRNVRFLEYNIWVNVLITSSFTAQEIWSSYLLTFLYQVKILFPCWSFRKYLFKPIHVQWTITETVSIEPCHKHTRENISPHKHETRRHYKRSPTMQQWNAIPVAGN